jgi:hypothetical protein
LCKLKPHEKFGNLTITPSWRKVSVGEEKRERKKGFWEETDESKKVVINENTIQKIMNKMEMYTGRIVKLKEN